MKRDIFLKQMRKLNRKNNSKYKSSVFKDKTKYDRKKLKVDYLYMRKKNEI